MLKHEFPVTKTARFFTNGALGKSRKNLWYCLHGQGQLAEYFIKKFEILAPEEHLLVAPEGLSRYYTQGFTGRVGASWMTKDDRETEISDYLLYLEKLRHHIEDQNPAEDKRIVLGFSQGAATACRWANEFQDCCDVLVLWGSIFPPDLKFKAQPFHQNLRIWQVIGRQDPFLTEKRLEENRRIINALGIEAQEFWFDGQHEIPADAFQAFTKKAGLSG